MPRAEDTATVGVDRNGNDLPGMIGMLTDGAVKALHASGIQLIEQFSIEIAFVVLRQQIEDIAGKQLALMEFFRGGI